MTDRPLGEPYEPLTSYSIRCLCLAEKFSSKKNLAVQIRQKKKLLRADSPEKKTASGDFARKKNASVWTRQKKKRLSADCPRAKISKAPPPARTPNR